METALFQLAAAPERPHVGRREAFGLPIAFWMMLGNAFIMSVGFFMLIPLASVHYTTTLGFSAASVGLALAIRQFSQQGLMLATGSLAERVGYRPVLVAGLLIRSAGFALFPFSDTMPRLIGASLVAAVGGALFEVSCRSLVAVLLPVARRADGTLGQSAARRRQRSNSGPAPQSTKTKMLPQRCSLPAMNNSLARPKGPLCRSKNQILLIRARAICRHRASNSGSSKKSRWLRIRRLQLPAHV
jgi:hypothetical protein